MSFGNGVLFEIKHVIHGEGRAQRIGLNEREFIAGTTLMIRIPFYVQLPFAAPSKYYFALYCLLSEVEIFGLEELKCLTIF